MTDARDVEREAREIADHYKNRLMFMQYDSLVERIAAAFQRREEEIAKERDDNKAWALDRAAVAIQMADERDALKAQHEAALRDAREAHEVIQIRDGQLYEAGEYLEANRDLQVKLAEAQREIERLTKRQAIYNAEYQDVCAELDAAEQRAETAEAQVRALRERIEGLARAYDLAPSKDLSGASVARDLRALTTPPASQPSPNA